ncbi:MAG: hypothetical protein V3W14_07940 [Candidatus Neomarinimicrobiota bacterium]
MIEEAKFKCLRCGQEWVGPFDRKVLRERTCSKCGSNSVRKLKGRVSRDGRPAPAKA